MSDLPSEFREVPRGDIEDPYSLDQADARAAIRLHPERDVVRIGKLIADAINCGVYGPFERKQ